jgi:hypothetical protein
MHVPLQLTDPPPQLVAHFASLQTCPGRHAVVQSPQCFRSFAVSTHVLCPPSAPASPPPEHNVKPCPHCAEQ